MGLPPAIRGNAPIGLLQPNTSLNVNPSRDVVGNVYYGRGEAPVQHLRVCSGQVNGDARPDQLITFARCVLESFPIEYRDFPPAARDQTGILQFPGGIRDGWPLDP